MEKKEKLLPNGIFISYRRDDSNHAAGRLMDVLLEVLADKIPRERFFMDIDDIELGADFHKILSERLDTCDVMLTLIGPRWLKSVDQDGKRRIDNENDFVRIEIESAIRRNVRIIPVLIDGASMPLKGELPECLHHLTHRQAAKIAHESFARDAGRIAESILRSQVVSKSERLSGQRVKSKLGPNVKKKSSSNNVVVQIGGREYSISTQEGDENYLRSAAELFDIEASQIQEQAGRLPEARVLLLAGMMLADKMGGMADKIAALETRLKNST